MYKTATITYTYGNGLISDSKKEAKDSDTEKRYYHYNHIGSTTAITDADGDLLYRIAYGTYGELTGIYDADGQKMAGEAADQRSIRETLQAETLRFLYNGRYGVETGADGLYYMRARYYNPQIKRFINRDIIDGSITDSQSLNKYSYVHGNPISLVDPFGLCAQDYFSRAGHELLDWLGFIFDPADAINFLWYTAEGNAAMAAATAVAIVPAAGSFIAKGTKQAIKAGKKAAQKAGEKAVRNVTEKAAKKAAKKKLTKEAAEKGAEKAAKEAAEKTAKETAEKTAKEAAEKGIKSGNKTSTVWDNITSTADNMPATEIPATFKIDLDGNINYVSPETGTNTLWTNSNATKHMGEYVSRFGDESWSIGTRSQVMLESYSASLNKAMETIGTEAPGRYFGTYGNWELGINTATGVVYHARMIN